MNLFFQFSFGKMVCPTNYGVRTDFKSTKKNYQYALDNSKITLSHDIELGIIRVFETEIQAVRKVEAYKQELMSFQDYSMLEIFRCIDQFAHGYINQDNLRVFFKGFDFCIDLDEDDLAAYIRRYDRDVDKQLDYADFVRALGPYCQYNQRAETNESKTGERDSMRDGFGDEEDPMMIQNSYQKIDASSERIAKHDTLKPMQSGRALSRMTKTTAASQNATKFDKYRSSRIVKGSIHAQSEKPMKKRVDPFKGAAKGSVSAIT